MNFAMVGTIKHCLTGLIVAFLGGAAYIFELRLGHVYRDVTESRQEISFLKQKIKDLKSNLQANQMELTEIKRRFVECERILNHTIREKEKEANIVSQDLKKVFEKEKIERQLQIDNIEKKSIQERERIVANFVKEEIPKINKIIENERKERQLQINNIRNTDISRRIAFHANSPSDFKNLALHQPLIFGRVILNQGNQYHHSTGVFTPNVSGVYVFYVQLVVSLDGYVHTELVVEGVSKGGHFVQSPTPGGYYNGGGMTIVHVNAGDSVWVRLGTPHGTNSFGWESSFSGYLLYEDQ